MYDFIKRFLCLFIVSAWDMKVQYIDAEGTNLGREKKLLSIKRLSGENDIPANVIISRCRAFQWNFPGMVRLLLPISFISPPNNMKLIPNDIKWHHLKIHCIKIVDRTKHYMQFIDLMVSMFSSGGFRIFLSRGGAPTPKVEARTYYFGQCFQKLHKNETYWIERGCTFLVSPLDPPMLRYW